VDQRIGEFFTAGGKLLLGRKKGFPQAGKPVDDRWENRKSINLNGPLDG
jgi:hypothetical protein